MQINCRVGYGSEPPAQVRRLIDNERGCCVGVWALFLTIVGGLNIIIFWVCSS